MERRLAAIVATDVVGYSALMERDEAGTHERLKAGRVELFEPEIARHHGRIFKLMGDGMLAEFASVVDAVECAVSLQRGLAERNAVVPEDQRIAVRIGINLGEVIVEGEDRYGKGVNLASRLQQLADPGGICVSAKVVREVEYKLAFGFESLGEQKVKNIAEPVQVFRVQLDGAPVKRVIPTKAKRLGPWAAVIAVLGALAIVWFVVMKPVDAPAPATISWIAVLPFDNLSGDPSLGYLGDGIAEDIITMLSRFPDLAVIARNSSFAYKGKPEDVRKIGKELGVGYVLEGSVRKQAGEMRIVAQLIDTSDGKHVWAERFDESGSDPFALQDAVTAKIIAAIAGENGEIRYAEYRRAWGKDTVNLEEYDYASRAHSYISQETKKGYEAALAISREGLVKFPDSNLLKVKSGIAHFFYAFSFWSPDPQADYRDAGLLAREVLTATNLTPQVARLVHWLMAYVLLQENDFKQAITEAEKAVALAPNDAGLAGNLSMILTMSGKPDQGIEWAEKGIALNPGARPWLYYRLGLAYSLKGDNEKSIAALKQSAKLPDMILLMAIGYLRLGQLDEAQAEYKRALAIDPTFTQAMWREGYFYSDPSVVEGQVADLARIGLPAQ